MTDKAIQGLQHPHSWQYSPLMADIEWTSFCRQHFQVYFDWQSVTCITNVNKSSLVHVIAWWQTGTKPSHEPTRYVNGTPTSEVTLVTIRYIYPSHHGHTRSISWPWMDDSQSFCTMSISPPILEIRLFQTLTLKLQGQGHECGQRARSWSQFSI